MGQKEDFHITLYATGGLFSTLGLVALVQFVRNCRSHRIWTTQKQIHLLALCGCAARATFLFLAETWWNEQNNKVDTKTFADHEAFYVLDELASLIFLVVYVLLVLFWAKVYCYSLDNAEWYHRTIRPAGLGSITLIAAGHIIIWVIYGTVKGGPTSKEPGRKSTHYVSLGFSIFSACIFIWMAAILLWFSRLSYQGLRSVPVELRVRTSKGFEVIAIAIVWTICFTARAVLLVLLAYDNQDLEKKLSFVFMAIYFSLLEVLPMAVVLFYYRRVPAPMDYSVFEDSNQQGLLVADDDLMEPAGGKAGLG